MPILITVDCRSGLSLAYDATLIPNSMTWSVVLDPVESGEVCEILIGDGLDSVLLKDVLFGDVWFCSGQSNMGWAIKGDRARKELITY